MYIFRNETKPVDWLGSSLKTFQGLSPDIRRRVARQLDRVSSGVEASNWKPMSSIGPGVEELRIRAGTDWRVIYVARFPEAVYVIHVFEKKSRKAPQRDIDLASGRYADLLRMRRTRFRGPAIAQEPNK